MSIFAENSNFGNSNNYSAYGAERNSYGTGFREKEIIMKTNTFDYEIKNDFWSEQYALPQWAKLENDRGAYAWTDVYARKNTQAGLRTRRVIARLFYRLADMLSPETMNA